MPLLASKIVLLRKRETTYGTDPTPAGTDAAIAYDLTGNPWDADTVGRQPMRPWLGRGAAGKQANAKGQLGYALELAGGGAAGTVPKCGVDLRACGFSETVNPGTDVQYLPASASFDAITAYFNRDGQRWRANGMRGNAQLSFVSGETPKAIFAMTGLPIAPDDSALPTPDWTGWTEPLIVNEVNTPTFTIHSYAAALQSMTVNMAMVVAFRDWVNSKDVNLTNRMPVGTLVIEKPTIAAKDFYAAVRADTLAPLQLIHGGTVGNIVQLDMPKVQLTQPVDGELNGIATLTMQMELNPSAGDDEVKLTFK